jgi:hypothetical protein
MSLFVESVTNNPSPWLDSTTGFACRKGRTNRTMTSAFPAKQGVIAPESVCFDPELNQDADASLRRRTQDARRTLNFMDANRSARSSRHQKMPTYVVRVFTGTGHLES